MNGTPGDDETRDAVDLAYQPIRGEWAAATMRVHILSGRSALLRADRAGGR
jgi:hypothetical protein